MNTYERRHSIFEPIGQNSTNTLNASNGNTQYMQFNQANTINVDFNRSFVENQVESTSKKRKSTTSNNLIKCAECGEMKILGGHNRCRACYQRFYQQSVKSNDSKKKVCTDCGELRAHRGRGMCSACWSRKRTKSIKLDESKKKICVGCNESKLIHARELCTACYHVSTYQIRKLDESKKKACGDCGKMKLIYGKGLCGACYQRQKLQNDKSDESKLKACTECKKEKVLYAKGFCHTCYQTVFSRPKRKAKLMEVKQIVDHISKQFTEMKAEYVDKFELSKNIRFKCDGLNSKTVVQIEIKCRPSTSKQ